MDHDSLFDRLPHRGNRIPPERRESCRERALIEGISLFEISGEPGRKRRANARLRSLCDSTTITMKTKATDCLD